MGQLCSFGCWDKLCKVLGLRAAVLVGRQEESKATARGMLPAHRRITPLIPAPLPPRVATSSVDRGTFHLPNHVSSCPSCASVCSETSALRDSYLSPVQLALCADNKNQNDDDHSADHREKNPDVVVRLLDKTGKKLLVCGRDGNERLGRGIPISSWPSACEHVILGQALPPCSFQVKDKVLSLFCTFQQEWNFSALQHLSSLEAMVQGSTR